MTEELQLPGSGTVERTVHVMRYFALHPEVTLTQLATALCMSPSTCHRLLELLGNEGIITHVKTRRIYRVGPEYYRLAALIQAHNPMTKFVLPILEGMVQDYNETCIFSSYLPSRRRMIFAEKVESTRSLRYQVPLNEPMTVLWGATGRAIYAFLPEAVRRDILAAETPAPGSGQAVPGWVDLEVDLAVIREKGYALTSGQRTPGAVGIGAPVFNAENTVVGSVSFTIAQGQAEAYDLHALGLYVARKGLVMSSMLGSTVASSMAAE